MIWMRFFEGGGGGEGESCWSERYVVLLYLCKKKSSGEEAVVALLAGSPSRLGRWWEGPSIGLLRESLTITTT